MEGQLEDKPETEENCSQCAPDQSDGQGTSDERRGFIEGTGLFSCRTSVAPWSLRDVIVASVLLFPVGVGGSLGLGLALIRTGLVADKTLAAVLGSVLLPTTLLAGAWIFGVRRHKVSLNSLGFRRTSLTSVTWLPLVALSIGLSATAVYALLAQWLGIDILVPDQGLEEIAALDGAAMLPTFAIVGLLAPFAEEVFFRGFLLAALASVIGGLRGALVSSAIFSVAHLNVGTLAPIFVMGMLLAWLYLRTGSIWPPIVAHAAQNLIALTVLELPIETPAAYLQT
ncbi:MAG: CPBP family intramembrane metalloprotease [Chloroflexi bacterium]|nr:CPBP family intramembrane metalloprotease [Chloroflexota bacterium]